MSISVLPDEILLGIFDFCASEHQVEKGDIEAWQLLVHVCRRWRRIVFGSPCRLNLRLVGTSKTPVRDTLDVWPTLPLLIDDNGRLAEGLDNIIAMLEHRNRVSQIKLRFRSSLLLEKIMAAMQLPFPELTHLVLSSYSETVLVIPDSFLATSAPRLRHLSLKHFLFPALPNLLLSAAHLVDLHLRNIPRSAYIPPETVATLIPTLTSLESLSLEFKSAQSRPDRASRRPPPPARSVLFVLTSFSFQGAKEYIDDLVACIDAPRLNSLFITFFKEFEINTPQLIQFICRTPGLKALKEAHLAFNYQATWVYLSSGCRALCVKNFCRTLCEQLSSLEEICTSTLPPLSTFENLYISDVPHWQLDQLDYMESDTEELLWLELLSKFTEVKSLYLSEEMAQRVLPALPEFGGETTEVLPTLENIFLEELQPSEPVQECIEDFVAERQVTSHPVAVSLWDRQPTSQMYLRWLAQDLRVWSF